MWIKVWITIFVVGFAHGENWDKCPNYPDSYVPYCYSSGPNQNCQLPDCACAGQEPEPDVKERPQIVYLTFDDAMTAEFDENFYSKLFLPGDDGSYPYTNPNGCPIRSTFFVCGKSNEYPVTNKYYSYGHEIAAHSITHRTNTTYWRTITTKQWADEMNGVKQMISKFANIPEEDIIGMRTPFLQSGGDEMLQMMMENNFEYDCSAPSRNFGYTHMDKGRWPFTYDWYSDMDCQIEPCPQCDFQGIWSQPILDFEDGRDNGLGHGYPCGMTDTCQVTDENPDSIFNMFMKNFDASYNGKTRAPIGLYIHSAWFVRTNSWHFEGYKKFLDHITQLDDVWIVPIRDGIEYMKNGSLTNEDLINKEFEPFNCDAPVPNPDVECEETECPFTVNNEDIIGPIDYRLRICGYSCPRNFPWLGNPLGM